MTSVTVSLAFTRNLGNFESVKINLGVTDDVREGETVEDATNRVYKFVERKLTEKTDEVENELSQYRNVISKGN